MRRHNTNTTRYDTSQHSILKCYTKTIHKYNAQYIIWHLWQYILQCLHQNILQYNKYCNTCIDDHQISSNLLQNPIVCDSLLYNAIKRLKRPCMKIRDDACRWNTIKFDAVLPTLRYGTVYEKIYIHRCKHVSRMIAYMFRYIHALHYTVLHDSTPHNITRHGIQALHTHTNGYIRPHARQQAYILQTYMTGYIYDNIHQDLATMNYLKKNDATSHYIAIHLPLPDMPLHCI